MGLSKEQLAEIAEIKSRIRVSKVVVTRSVKTPRGDFFVGFSAAWDSLQEDAGGGGADLIDAMDSGEQQAAIDHRGMTLRQAKLASLILAKEVDIQAWTNAFCGGSVSVQDHAKALEGIKNNFNLKIAEVFSKAGE